MRMKKILIAFLVLTTLTQASWAILDEKKISIKEAIEKALETNPQIKMLDMDVQMSKNNTKQANRLQNPSLDVFKSMGTSIEGEPQLVGGTYLVELFKRGKRKQQAKANELVAYNNKYFNEYDLILQVRKAYIDLLLKKSNLNILKEQQKLAQELYESLQKDVKLGKVPQTEALQAKIALNRAVMAVNNAKSNVIFSQNRFNTVMNTADVEYDTKEDKLNGNYHELLTIEPTNDMLEYNKIKAFALERRFDLQKARQEVVAAQKNLSVVKSQLIPDIEVSAGYGYRTASKGDLPRPGPERRPGGGRGAGAPDGGGPDGPGPAAAGVRRPGDGAGGPGGGQRRPSVPVLPPAQPARRGALLRPHRREVPGGRPHPGAGGRRPGDGGGAPPAGPHLVPGDGGPALPGGAAGGVPAGPAGGGPLPLWRCASWPCRRRTPPPWCWTTPSSTSTTPAWPWPWTASRTWPGSGRSSSSPATAGRGRGWRAEPKKIFPGPVTNASRRTIYPIETLPWREYGGNRHGRKERKTRAAGAFPAAGGVRGRCAGGGAAVAGGVEPDRPSAGADGGSADFA